MDDLSDIRTQDRLRRELAIKLGKAVIDAVEAGLNPDGALKATAEIYWQEVRLQKSRQDAALSYS
jgi:hypothetical protein